MKNYATTIELPPTGRADWNDDSDRAAELREKMQRALDRGDMAEFARVLEQAKGDE